MTHCVIPRTPRIELDGYPQVSRVSREPDPVQAQFDGIPVPCYVWHHSDRGFELERANRAAYDMTGPRLAEIIGRSVTEIFANEP